MNKKYWLIFIMIFLPVIVFSQVVSIYCTWDDLEAARQQRIFGAGILDMIRQAGYAVTEKSFPNQKIADSLITSEIRLVIGSSHGDEYTFYDCNDWSAIWTSTYPKHLGPMEGKIVHLLACLNGQHLAPKMVDQGGALAVLAYTETFNFSNSSKYNDLNALADAEFDRALLQENATAENAYIKAKNKFIEFANQASEEGNAEEYETLMHNANCIALFGSQTARLVPGESSTRSVKPSVRKFSKPSQAILNKIYAAKSGNTPLNFTEYTKERQAKRAGIKNYSTLSSEEFKELCLYRYENLDDSYQLGIRSLKTGLLNKQQILEEIQNNTPTGEFLLRRYKKILEKMEEFLEE